jgi:hypothetical protein
VSVPTPYDLLGSIVLAHRPADLPELVGGQAFFPDRTAATGALHGRMRLRGALYGRVAPKRELRVLVLDGEQEVALVCRANRFIGC